MKVTLSLPDELYESYALAVKGTKLTPETQMVAHLTTLAPIKPNQRAIIVTGADLNELERRFGRSLNVAGELVQLVDALASLSIGSYKLELSPGQLVAAQQRATRLGMTFEAYLADIYARIGVWITEEI